VVDTAIYCIKVEIGVVGPTRPLADCRRAYWAGGS